VVQSTWGAYTGPADGKTVTVALFDHPENPRPAWFFTMTTPFAYISATINLAKEPLPLAAGRPLRLRYGAALWDGTPDRAAVERMHRRWIGVAPKSD